MKFSEHALYEIERRKIEIEVVKNVVLKPQQILSSAKGRIILQSKFYDTIENKEMLLRVIFKEDKKVKKVVTVYKTSKINKYWEKENNL